MVGEVSKNDDGSLHIRPGGYPGQLVLQDVLTLHGSQFRNAACIVASLPCQKYSVHVDAVVATKRITAEIQESPERIAELNWLFDACFRIQREASAAAGHHIPMVVENVKGAQRWVGRAAWHFGSFYLWGDVPAVMPFALGRKSSTGSWDLTRENYTPDHSWDANSKGFGGYWFAQNHNRESGSAGNPVDGTGVKAPGNDTFKRTGQPCGKFTDPRYPSGGVKQHGLRRGLVR